MGAARFTSSRVLATACTAMPSASFSWPEATTRWPSRKPSRMATLPPCPLAQFHAHALDGQRLLALLLRDEHRVAVRVVGHGRFRHRQLLARYARHAHIRVHARPQGAAGMGQRRLHLHHARAGDQRIDGVDLRREGFIGIGVHQHLHGLARRQLGAALFIEGEVHQQRLRVDQTGHRVGRVQVLTRVHLADAQLAGERRADGLLRDQRFRLSHVAQGRVARGQGAIELLLRGRLFPDHLRRAGKAAFRVFQLRALAQQGRPFLGVIELHEDGAGRHALARLEADLRDAPARFSRHQHLARRFQFAHAGEVALLRAQHDGDQRHLGGVSGGGIGRLRVRARVQRGARDGQRDGQRGGADEFRMHDEVLYSSHKEERRSGG